MIRSRGLFITAACFMMCIPGFFAAGQLQASGTFPDQAPQPFVLEEFVEDRGLRGSRWVLVDKSGFSLFMYEGFREIARFPVALGKNPGDKQRAGDMRTPEGIFRVVSIHDSKHWVHDFGDGEGPVAGAYGPWFIRLETGWKGIGIHGTHDPASLGTLASEGCVRMKNEDLLHLVGLTPPGTVVVVLP